MSNKYDDRLVRLECLKLANGLAMAMKEGRTESVQTIAESYYKFLVKGDEGVARITLPDDMTEDEANNIIQQFARTRRRAQTGSLMVNA